MQEFKKNFTKKLLKSENKNDISRFLVQIKEFNDNDSKFPD